MKLDPALNPAHQIWVRSVIPFLRFVLDQSFIFWCSNLGTETVVTMYE